MTTNPRWDQTPAWSPDGKRIAFEFTRDGAHASDIYVINIDGSEQRNLTDHVYVDATPSWSPDGKKIAFASVRDTESGSLMSRVEIYVMNADGSELRRLTRDFFEDSYPCWSPDGKKIAFIREDMREKKKYICVMMADGSKQKKLTDAPVEQRGLSWSPPLTLVSPRKSR